MLRKILAVDDSALIHQMYKLFLSRYKNCKLISAMNGLEALDKLGQEEGIDLILLDINMPVMNGLEFLQRVQKEPAYQAIPVIIISTEGKEEDTIRGLKMGAKGYVKKPFQASELHGLIEKITAAAEPAAAMSDFQVSPELLDIYLEDARGHLEALDHCLLALEREGFDPEVVAAVLGPLHTLKGNSGMMGFSGIKDYVHRLEDVFAASATGALPLVAEPSSTGCSPAPPRCATRWSGPAGRRRGPRPAPEMAALDALLARTAARRGPAPRPRAAPALRQPRRRTAGARRTVRRRPARGRTRATSPRAPAWCAWTSRQLDHLLNLVGELIIFRTKLARAGPGAGRAAGRPRRPRAS